MTIVKDRGGGAVKELVDDISIAQGCVGKRIMRASICTNHKGGAILQHLLSRLTSYP